MSNGRITALLACHDRRSATLACLRSLVAQRTEEIDVSVVLVDDGSADDTATAVAAEHPHVEIVQGNGTLYWARAMAIAERVALASDPDFVLWLNDDVELQPGALETMLDVSRRYDDHVIVCGVAVDPATKEVTYSGVRRTGWHPMRFTRVVPNGTSEIADTFNGNIVLIPRLPRLAIGAIDGEFEHALADYDYGLRGAKRGIRTVVVPHPIATCRRDSPRTHRFDPDQPVVQQWRRLLSPTGLPPRSLVRYLKRHGGLFWPFPAVAPYVRFWLDALLHQLRTRRIRSGVVE